MFRKREKTDGPEVNKRLTEQEEKTKNIEVRLRRIELEVGILNPRLRRQRPV